MRWDDLDFEKSLWNVRAEDMKSGRAHTIPLSECAMAVLRSIPKQNGPYIFGRFGSSPFSGFSKGKRALLEASGTDNWRIHDLRRSANTRLIAFTDKDVRRRILDHVPDARDIEALHYDQFNWLPRMRAALDLLGNHINTTVSDQQDDVLQIVGRYDNA
jgi:integrase